MCQFYLILVFSHVIQKVLRCVLNFLALRFYTVSSWKMLLETISVSSIAGMLTRNRTAVQSPSSRWLLLPFSWSLYWGQCCSVALTSAFGDSELKELTEGPRASLMAGR